MDYESYKTSSLFDEQNSNIESYRQNSEVPQELQDKIFKLQNDIIFFFNSTNKLSFFESIENLCLILNSEPKIILHIIKIAWNQDFGVCILKSLQSFLNSENSPTKFITSNLFLIAKLLKSTTVQRFYSQSPLTSVVYNLLYKSRNQTDVIEECLHVLLKTCKFYDVTLYPTNTTLPYPLGEILTNFKEIYKLSERCEVFVCRYLKQVILFFDITTKKNWIFSKNICDIFYFIIENKTDQSTRSVKHIMNSLTHLLRCDSLTKLNIIIQSEIIQSFLKYLNRTQQPIFEECPCYLVPFLDFIQTAVFVGDYREIYKIFKTIHTNFFLKLYKNHSNPQIQIKILDIFMSRLHRMFCDDDKIRTREIDAITSMLCTVLKEFKNNNYDQKSQVVNFIETLMDLNKEGTCRLLMEFSKTFFFHISYFALNSDDELFDRYISLLGKTLSYTVDLSAEGFAECSPAKSFIGFFNEYQLDELIPSFISREDLNKNIVEKAKLLMKNIELVNEKLDQELDCGDDLEEESK